LGLIEQLIAAAREGVERRREQTPQPALEARLESRGEDRPSTKALVRPGLSLIAEFKRRSPSAGRISEGSGVAPQVQAYERGGAAALSVLTEEDHFGGSLEDLRDARAACDLPILRKDIIVDPYQLYEAAVDGADAVLLIVRALGTTACAAADEAGATRPRLPGRGPRRRGARAGAGAGGRGDRDQQPRPRRRHGRRRHHLRADADVPAGKTVVAESGISDRVSWRSWSGRGGRGADRRGADAGPDAEAKTRELAGDDEGTREHCCPEQGFRNFSRRFRDG
jgi:indole-3-glycerol phosphate synthase